MSGAASKRADSSEEEEEEEEGEKEDAEEVGDDSDYGTPDVSHFTPDLETDYPYYRFVLFPSFLISKFYFMYFF